MRRTLLERYASPVQFDRIRRTFAARLTRRFVALARRRLARPFACARRKLCSGDRACFVCNRPIVHLSLFTHVPLLPIVQRECGLQSITTS